MDLSAVRPVYITIRYISSVICVTILMANLLPAVFARQALRSFAFATSLYPISAVLLPPNTILNTTAIAGRIISPIIPNKE